MDQKIITTKTAGSQVLFGLNDTQQMMVAFGDCRRPNIETAIIVESVVLMQMTEIIHRASEVSHQRGYKSLQLESILYLMKNSPHKIQRLIKYLSAKEITRKAQRESEGEVDEIKPRSLVGRCKDFIEEIDDTGKLMAACHEKYFDEVYIERLLKNDKITRKMDNKRYEEFCKARIVGFRGNYSSKYQAALENIKSSVDIRFEKTADDLLSYLAYETLGQLIEMCLLLRNESVYDPVDRLVTPLAVNPDYPTLSIPLPAEKPDGKADLSDHPITPAELREVLRRLQESEQRDKPLGRHRGHSCTMPLIAL